MEESEIKIGTKVNYAAIVLEDDERLDECETVITSEPWQLGHGEWVCKVEGVRGGVCISHLKKID